MKKISALAVCALAATASLPSFATDHVGKTVSELQANHTATDCFYFRLDGVSEADPVKPNDPWFAVSRTAYGAKDAYALLLAARVTGTAVHIVTTGAMVCGYASASFVFM